MTLRPFLKNFPLILLVFLIACGYETEFPADSAAECYDDEIYDAEAGVCYLACVDDGTCEEGDFFGLIGEVFGDIGSIVFSDGEGEALIVYDVNGDSLGDAELFEAVTDQDFEIQEDEALHEDVWQTFVTLIPTDDREYLSQYGVFTDGEGETMAYVEPDPEDPTQWRMVIDVLDTENQRDFIYTLLHEYAHILTLNDGQVPFDEDVYFSDDESIYEEAAEACATFFTGEGCALPDSYMNAFFQRFWTEIYEQNQAIDPENYDGLYDFYLDYENQFVSDYAATNPGEDIAESWTAFILQQKPTGNSIADQKILFFYDYPELVEMRNEILPSVYELSR